MNFQQKGRGHLENNHSFIIAITGCIGSGKTTVSEYLIQNGYQVISGDEVSRKYLSHPKVIQKIQNIVHIKKIDKLDLKYIGSYFDENPNDEILFERWYQPFLGQQIQSQINNHNIKFVFWDMPYLKQKSIEEIFDVIWVINTNAEECRCRIRKRNNYSDSKINFMIELSSAEYKFNNIIVIDNNSDKQSLIFHINRALQQTIFLYYAKQIRCSVSQWYPNLICCPDVVAGRNGKFWFEKKERFIHQLETPITDEDITTIAIILESPHKSEFNIKNYVFETASNPALGKTGSKLQKFFTDEYLHSIIPELPSKYRVILMNSIQYQCSLGESPKKFRDHIWLSLWLGSHEAIQDSFLERLHLYHPDYIFNLCTKGNHSDEVLNYDLRAKTVINHKYIEYCLQDSFSETDSIPEMEKYTIRSIVTLSIKKHIAHHLHSNEKKIVLFEGGHPSGWRKSTSLNDLIHIT